MDASSCVVVVRMPLSGRDLRDLTGAGRIRTKNEVHCSEIKALYAVSGGEHRAWRDQDRRAVWLVVKSQGSDCSCCDLKWAAGITSAATGVESDVQVTIC